MIPIAVAVITAAAAVIYWYLNTDKPIRHILSELRSSIGMQVGVTVGLIDDWANFRRNKIVLPDAKKKIAVITGGARGIGKEVIKGLLKANMTVIMGIRKPEVAKDLKDSMQNGDNLHPFKLNLQSLKSVKEFSENILAKYPKINLLVNNAGIMFVDYKLTEDGIESQLAVNHLSHFYLTHLLLPALKKGGTVDEAARVVNVTSGAHYPSKINFDDINMEEHYDKIDAYCRSKLAQLMSTRYTNQLLTEQDIPVKCYAVHPGVVDTDIFEKTILRKMFPWVMKLLFKTPERGAISILHACFNKDLENKGGLYISNCIEGMSNSFSKKVDSQKRLFKLSCKLVGIDEDKFAKGV